MLIKKASVQLVKFGITSLVLNGLPSVGEGLARDGSGSSEIVRRSGALEDGVGLDKKTAGLG